MNFIEALQYPFQDNTWMNKLLFAIVMVFIPIIGWAILYGYMLRVIRSILVGDGRLPEWDDWGGDLTRGVIAFFGALIYQFPSILISCCTTFLGAMDNSAATALSCLLQMAQLGYGIVIMPLMYAAIARYAVTEDFNVFLDFGARLKDLTDNAGEAVMFYLNFLALGFIGGFLVGIGLLMFCIPGLIAWAFFAFANAHLISQWGRIIGAGNSGAPASGFNPAF